MIRGVTCLSCRPRPSRGCGTHSLNIFRSKSHRHQLEDVSVKTPPQARADATRDIALKSIQPIQTGNLLLCRCLITAGPRTSVSRTLQIIQSLVTDADTPPHMQHTQEQTGMLQRMRMEQDRRTTPSVSVPWPFVTCWPSTILQRAHASKCSSTVRTQHRHRREQV